MSLFNKFKKSKDANDTLQHQKQSDLWLSGLWECCKRSAVLEYPHADCENEVVKQHTVDLFNNVCLKLKLVQGVHN